MASLLLTLTDVLLQIGTLFPRGICALCVSIKWYPRSPLHEWLLWRRTDTLSRTVELEPTPGVGSSSRVQLQSHINIEQKNDSILIGKHRHIGCPLVNTSLACLLSQLAVVLLKDPTETKPRSSARRENNCKKKRKQKNRKACSR